MDDISLGSTTKHSYKMKSFSFFLLLSFSFISMGIKAQIGIKHSQIEDIVGFPKKVTYWVAENHTKLNNDSIIFAYDSVGRIAHRVVYRPDKSVKTESYYFYDRIDNLINTHNSFEIDSSSMMIPTYNSSNQLVDLSRKNQKGECNPCSKYEYDANGNLITTINIYPFDRLETTYQYDPFNRIITETYTSQGLENPVVTKYTYTGPKNVINKTKSRKGYDTETWNYVYDTRDILIEEQYLRGATPVSKITYSYDFDSHGNWTSRTRYIDGQIASIEQRTITYP